MIKQVNNLLSAFKHCGWVNDLSEKQYDALNELQEAYDKLVEPKEYKNKQRKTAALLRKEGFTIREIAKVMGHKHPGSISHLLK